MAQWNRTIFTEFVSERGPGASPIIALANDASWATRILDVDWPNQLVAIDDFVGWATVQSTGLTYPSPPFWINRNVPMPFPFYIEQQLPYTNSLGNTVNPYPMLWCTKINRIQGIALEGSSFDAVYSGSLAFYNLARMELGFESLPYDILTDNDPNILGAGGFPDESLCTRYVTKFPQASADYISLKIGQLKIAEGSNIGTPLPFPAPKILVTEDLRFRWELVPREAVPSCAVNSFLTIGPASTGDGAAIEYTLGRVNGNWFPSPNNTAGVGYPPGTLLLMAAQMTPFRGANGRRLYTIEYFMKFLANGHHRLFAPKDGVTGGFVEVSADGTSYPITTSTPDGKHIYDVADFNWLFRPPVQGAIMVTEKTPNDLPQTVILGTP